MSTKLSETPRSSFVENAKEQLSRLNPNQSGKDLVLEYAKARESGNIDDMNNFILQTAKHIELKDEYILKYIKTKEELDKLDKLDKLNKNKNKNKNNDRISAMVKEYNDSSNSDDRVPCILSYNKADMELLAKELNRQGHSVGYKKLN